MRYALPFLLLFFLVGPSHAGEAEAGRSEIREAATPSAGPTLAQAVQQRIEREGSELDELYARLAQTRDPQAAIELQKEVARVKLQTEIDILQLQLDRAEALGKREQVQQLAEAIEGLKNPPRASAPPEKVQHRSPSAQR